MWALILCKENNPDRKNDGSKGDCRAIASVQCYSCLDLRVGSGRRTEPVRVGEPDLTLGLSAPNSENSWGGRLRRSPRTPEDCALTPRCDRPEGDWFGGAPDKTYGLHRKPREVELALDIRTIPRGIYFLRLRAGGQTRTQKLTIVQ